MKSITKIVVALALVLSMLGFGASSAQAVQPASGPVQIVPPTTGQVQPKTIVYLKVASNSERTVRVCTFFSGVGPCNNVKPGHHTFLGVDSIQVDRGCELFESGVRVGVRKDHDYWHNEKWGAIDAKRTVRLSNCRSGSRGDVAPRN